MGTLEAQSTRSQQRRILRLEAMGRYSEAADLHIALHDAGERESSIKAAMNLYKAARYSEAIRYFEHADSIGTLDHEDEVYGYFECLKSAGSYNEADRLLQTHIETVGDNPLFRLNVDKQSLYNKILSYGKTRISTVPVNSVHSEFGPALYDGFLYFQSTRPAKGSKALKDFFNLFAHPLGDSLNTIVQPKGVFGKPAETITAGNRKTISIPADINKSHNDGPLYITPDGRYLFYTTNWNHQGKKSFRNPYLNLDYDHQALENAQKVEVGRITLNIYYSIKEGDTWGMPVPFPYNDDRWSNQHACFDQTTGTLFFSSNRPGGFGGFDIWKSVLDGANWSEPENLGPHINTVKNEVFPTLGPEGHLIFSSNGWPGLGGLDAFISGFPGMDPLNMLEGINSAMDDFGLVFTGKGNGFFVSNRTGAVGEDDIFAFEADVEDILDHHFPERKIVLVDSKSGDRLNGQIVISEPDTTRVFEVGKEGLSVRLFGQEANVKVIINGYAEINASLDAFLGEDRVCSISLEALPPPAVVRAGRVYFDYQGATIRKDAAVVLDRLARTLNDNPAMVIQASAHSGCHAPTTRERLIMDRRLKVTLEYLQRRIMHPERVSAASVTENLNKRTCDCNYHESTHCEARACEGGLPYVWYGLVKDYIRNGR